MAVAHVRSAGSWNTGASTTVAQAFTGTLAAGNLIIVAFTAATTTTVNSVVDTAGNTYALACAATSLAAGDTGWLYYAKNIAGGSSQTVTVTFAAARDSRFIAVHEYSGADTTAPLDGGAGAGATGSVVTVTSPNRTTTVDNGLVFGFDYTYSTVASWTSMTQRVNVIGIATADKNSTTAGTYNTVATQSAAGAQWISLIACFKPASGAVFMAGQQQLQSQAVRMASVL